MFKLLIFLSIFFFGVKSDRCPTVSTVSPFDYMGKWYELERYPFIFEAFQKCVTAEYDLNTDGTVNVTNTGYTRIGEYALRANGRAVADPQNPSNLTVYFGTFGSASGGSYWVLDTDYDNYSLVYSCSQMSLLPITNEYAWILGRNKNISALDVSTITSLKQRLTDLGSHTNKFSLTAQDCDFN